MTGINAIVPNAVSRLRAMLKLLMLMATIALMTVGCDDRRSRIADLAEPTEETDLRQYELAQFIVESARDYETTLDSLKAFRAELERRRSK